MKKVFAFLLLCSCSLVGAQGVLDEQNPKVEEDSTVEVEEKKKNEKSEKEEPKKKQKELAPEELIPEFSLPKQIRVGETVPVDASGSTLLSPSSGAPNFSWLIDDRIQKVYGKIMNISFDNPGIHTIKLNINQGRKKKSLEKEILAYDRQAILITDKSKSDSLSLIDEQAAEMGIWLQRFELDSSDSISTEEILVQKLSENLENLRKSELILFYTGHSIGVQSFVQFWQKLSEENRFDLNEKLIVQLTDQNIKQVAKTTAPARNTLGVDSILITRPEVVQTILKSLKLPTIIEVLENRGNEYYLLDKQSQISAWPLTRLINYFVSKGVSQSVVYLLLAVPLLTFVISFFRQFVGVSTFGVFAPLMLSMSFMVLGITFGLIVFLVVMLVSYVIRNIFERVDLLYIPKVSLLLSFLSLSYLCILGLAVYFETQINLALAIFPMMVMSTISEKFLASQSSEGIKSALFATGITVFISFVAYRFVEWGWMKNLIIGRPEFIIIPLVLIFLLGKFTGLRLSEYLKFRALLREDIQEEE